MGKKAKKKRLKGEIIGKVKRPKCSLCYVDKQGNVRAMPAGKNGKGKGKAKGKKKTGVMWKGSHVSRGKKKGTYGFMLTSKHTPKKPRQGK